MTPFVDGCPFPWFKDHAHRRLAALRKDRLTYEEVCAKFDEAFAAFRHERLDRVEAPRFPSRMGGCHPGDRVDGRGMARRDGGQD